MHGTLAVLKACYPYWTTENLFNCACLIFNAIPIFQRSVRRRKSRQWGRKLKQQPRWMAARSVTKATSGVTSRGASHEPGFVTAPLTAPTQRMSFKVRRRHCVCSSNQAATGSNDEWRDLSVYRMQKKSVLLLGQMYLIRFDDKDFSETFDQLWHWSNSINNGMSSILYEVKVSLRNTKLASLSELKVSLPNTELVSTKVRLE